MNRIRTFRSKSTKLMRMGSEKEGVPRITSWLLSYVNRCIIETKMAPNG